MAEQSIKRNKFSEMTDRIIEQVKAGQAPWQKPWKGGVPFLPMNLSTGKPYMGINTFFLMGSGFSDPRWMTYNQAEKAGAQVRKGEKGTPIVYWLTETEITMRDAQGKPIRDEHGNTKKQKVELERPKAMWYNVFNAEQMDGVLPLVDKKYEEVTWESAERAERALQVVSGVQINEVLGSGQASYSFIRDVITLPGRGQFDTAADFYQTALHELGHATGHPSRLDRDMSGRFGSSQYAKEELIAELASLYLGAITGVGFTPNDEANHAAYIEHWVKMVEDNGNAISQAVSKATQAANFVLNKVIEYEKANGIEYDMYESIELMEALEPDKNQEQQAEGQDKDQAKENKAAQEREGRTYINVPYHEKNKAKALGAKWDKDLTSWYIPVGIDPKPFSKWMSDEIRQSAGQTQENAGARSTGTGSQAQGERDKTHNSLEMESEKERNYEATPEIDDFNTHWAIPDYEKMFGGEMLRTMNDLQLAAESAEISDLMGAVKKGRENPEHMVFEPFANALDRIEQIGEAILGDMLLSPDRQAGTVNPVKDSDHQDFAKDWQAVAAVIDEFETALKVAEIEKINQSTMAPEKVSETEVAAEEKKTYLAVPYREKEKAKALGAKWDKEARSWYVENDTITPENKEKLLVEYSKEKQASKTPPPSQLLPEEAFAQELEKLGCDLEAGRHPIMNGQKQRIRVQGDKGAEKSGFYVAYKDGCPNAFFMNNRTGETFKWKAKGHTLSEEQKQQLTERAAERRREYVLNREKNELKTQAQVQKNIQQWTPAAEATFSPGSYLEQKGISPTAGTFQTKYGDLCVPAMDIDGNVWSAQYIKADGSGKSFATDGRLKGTFHPIGQVDLEEVEKSNAIIITEGYATGCSIKDAVGESCTVIAAFKAHALKDVATEFREKYPDKPILIAGDDDKHLKRNPLIMKNVGAEAAKEAAGAVNGVAILPKFAPNESRSLEDKAFTDFNDLGNKSTLGMTAVKTQIEGGLTKAQKLVKQQDKEQNQSSEMAKAKPRKSPTVKTKTPEKTKPQGMEI